MRVLLVVGARPNFMKAAPIHRALSRREGVTPLLVHTGQHYDKNMSDVFFRDLDLPKPDRYLGVGPGSQGEQTGRVMIAFEPALGELEPDWVVVVGDVNSTLACALDSVKMGIPTVHVEAGLRSRDRTMPEEINRIATDAICDLLFAPSRDAEANLRAEGVSPAKIVFCGNVMIDALRQHEAAAAQSAILDELELPSGGYALVTAHRPANVDNPDTLGKLLDIIEDTAERLPVVFPMHPRTGNAIQGAGMAERIARWRGVRVIEPVSYLTMLRLEECARVALTDSAGVQEETTVFGVPCLTLRTTTERPITVEVGTNEVVALDRERIRRALDAILAGRWKSGAVPERWDGRAAERIADALLERGA